MLRSHEAVTLNLNWKTASFCWRRLPSSIDPIPSIQYIRRLLLSPDFLRLNASRSHYLRTRYEVRTMPSTLSFNDALALTLNVEASTWSKLILLALGIYLLCPNVVVKNSKLPSVGVTNWPCSNALATLHSVTNFRALLSEAYNKVHSPLGDCLSRTQQSYNPYSIYLEVFLAGSRTSFSALLWCFQRQS